MPTAQKSFIVFSLAVLLLILGLPQFVSVPTILGLKRNMDSLDSSFKIDISGTPIAKIASDGEHLTQAKLGSDAAVFKLKNGRLQSGDWYLGRNLTEDRSMLPKKVFWFKSSAESGENIHVVAAHKKGDSFELKFAGGTLIAEDGLVFANIMGGAESDVTITTCSDA